MSWFSGLLASSGTPIVNQNIVDFDSNKYGYEEIVVASGDVVNLIPNFSEKYSLTKIVSDNKCKYAINAGFYDKKGEALGLFEIDGKKTSEIHPTITFNGYVSKKDGDILITDEPIPAPDWAFQTGPILWQYEQPRIIKMTSDKLARRSVALRNTSGEIRFLHFYDLVYLADLPAILKKWSANNYFQISTAINLDGGGASGFYSPGKSINEIEPVGAVLCVR